MTVYWEMAAHSAYDMFSEYKYLIVNLVFPTLVFGVGISFRLRLFLIVASWNLFVSKNAAKTGINDGELINPT